MDDIRMDDRREEALRTVPEHLRGGIRRYVTQGVEPGGFLCAVIANDLRDSFGQADEDSRAGLFQIVSWFYNYAPGNCWGSVEAREAWIERHAKIREVAAEEARHNAPALPQAHSLAAHADKLPDLGKGEVPALTGLPQLLPVFPPGS